MDEEKTRRAMQRGGPPFSILVTRNEAALLYNVLCDNARSWNAGIRGQLEQFVSATDAFNARAEIWKYRND